MKRDVTNADLLALLNDLNALPTMGGTKEVFAKHDLDFDRLIGRVWKLARDQNIRSDFLNGHIGSALVDASKYNSEAVLKSALRQFHISREDGLEILREAIKRKTPQDVWISRPG